MNILKHFVKSFLGISFFFVLLFIAAGRVGYIQGWIYFTLSVFGLLINIASTKNKDDLISERSKPGANVQPWDKKILGLLAILTIIAYIVAGLDSGRFGWSAPFDIRMIVLGALLMIAGQVIFAVAKYQNAFFSSIARIQAERSHQVCNRGLYKFVRHPGYLGMILSWLGFPLILNSVYCSIPVLLAIILLIIRTNLEDKFLARDLSGYKEYMLKTRYRLLPAVW
jgi:protein-S-isoprenylcysteine O-methyltransferase Ste14